MISAITFIYWPEDVDVVETCLKSLAFCDEIIVIDNGGPKEAIKIARNYTDKIYTTTNSSFAFRHNLGKEKSNGDWLLYIDADERVSKNLQEEICKELAEPKSDAYQLWRVNYHLGKEVKYGDRIPDYVVRLFKKEKLKGWTGDVHESSHVNGKISQLKSPFYHLTHRAIYPMLEKTLNFSEHEAILRLHSGHPPVVWWRLIRVFLTEFYNRIIKMQGWRQGTEGWIDGLFQAFSLFIVYARLWELQQKPPLAEKYKEIDKKILEGLL